MKIMCEKSALDGFDLEKEFDRRFGVQERKAARTRRASAQAAA